MGCDIHIVVERRKKGSSEWVGTYCTDCLPFDSNVRIRQRDYSFFAEIAGVRGRSDTTTYPRNLPEDVSDLAWQQYMRCSTDYHNPSHMTVDEFLDAWFRVNKNSEIQREYADWKLLGAEAEDKYEFRVVFWFDN